MTYSLKDFQEIIGYDFKNENLLVEALTHSSFANEMKEEDIRHNERFEFLGDSVLSLVISDYLFENHKELAEGQLTKIRSKIVCESSLGECSRGMKFGHYMRFGKGEELTGGRERLSILADMMEAVIAAIYLDGGIEPARDFIFKFMMKTVEDAIEGKVFLDYKTHLQELVQINKSNRLKYEVIKEEGPDHSKVFHTHVKLNEKVIGLGKGRSKKESEQSAARAGVQALKES